MTIIWSCGYVLVVYNKDIHVTFWENIQQEMFWLKFLPEYSENLPLDSKENEELADICREGVRVEGVNEIVVLEEQVDMERATGVVWMVLETSMLVVMTTVSINTDEV